ncbi:MAG TPA: 5-methyltetrahydropteroyltriglutamate--homocysteine S-methyltransferase [Stellaceae bacterium]|nr:5-methyltetrahydropteroyltriglutamate--homocysteine S-methyltransferase [Stellaceae bacterium]
MRPPFRADHVGSLLRPARLKAARERLLGAQTADQNLGPHENEALRAVEDECIGEAIAMQERVGLWAATDGEFRRRSWWLELVMNWHGVSANRTGMSTDDLAWRNRDGVRQAFSRLYVTGKLEWRPSPIARALAFLKANTRIVPKVTIPAPILLHMYAGGDAGLAEGHYRDIDEFWTDVVAAYRRELAALIEAGARYIQFDDTSIAFLCDPRHRATVARWGNAPDALLAHHVRRMNEVMSDVPDEIVVTLHQWRGNREGNWAAAGGYDPVADRLFNEIDVDGYFLEYDTERAGGFAPLRLLPKGEKIVVLGIMSSKTPDLESVDALRRRVEDAARYAPLDQLALSPQCGFASSIVGNPMSEPEEEAKLARLVETARAVWGDIS